MLRFKNSEDILITVFIKSIYCVFDFEPAWRSAICSKIY